MAKIEMDISEYEAMKENKKLLETSLEKERELQNQIKKLTDEKTKALEDAKMKVVKISKSVVTEHLLRKRDDAHVWKELWYLLGIDYRQLPKMPTYIHTDHLSNVFFEKTKSYTMPIEETTTCGLDEIKAEIRDELKSKMDNDIACKIQNAEAALLKNDELLKEIKILTSDNNSYIEKNKKLTEQCDELAKKLTEHDDYYAKKFAEHENCNKIIMMIKYTLKNGYGFWNKSKLLDTIISLVK